jgi:hypothetical protein
MRRQDATVQKEGVASAGVVWSLRIWSRSSRKTNAPAGCQRYKKSRRVSRVRSVAKGTVGMPPSAAEAGTDLCDLRHG